MQAVFFRKLVKHYNIVVSDSEPTRSGSRMWESLLFDAMESPGHLAAVADISNGNVQLIETERQLAIQKKWLWGQKDFYRERLGVIAARS